MIVFDQLMNKAAVQLSKSVLLFELQDVSIACRNNTALSPRCFKLIHLPVGITLLSVIDVTNC